MATRHSGVRHYRSGVHSAAGYLIPSRPWLKGDGEVPNNGEERIDFPFLTKSFTVINKGPTDIRVHFASRSIAGVYGAGRYVGLPGGSNTSVTLDVLCKTIYISSTGNSATFQVVADLTNLEDNVTLAGEGIDS